MSLTELKANVVLESAFSAFLKQGNSIRKNFDQNKLQILVTELLANERKNNNILQKMDIEGSLVVVDIARYQSNFSEYEGKSPKKE